MGTLWGRTVIAVLIACLCYGAVIALPRYIRQRKTLPGRDAVALRAAVNEYYLAYTGVANIDSNYPATVQALASARSVLESSKKQLQELVSKSPKNIDTTTLDKIKQVLQSEVDIIKSFDEHYSTFSTAASYNPADNLSIDPESNAEALASRANAASNALKALINAHGTSLPQNTTKALSAASSCFANLASQVTNKSYGDAITTRNTCSSNYRDVRKQLIAYITQPVRKNTDIPNALESIVKDLDKLVTT